MRQVDPVKLILDIPDNRVQEIKKILTFRDKAAAHLHDRMSKNKHYLRTYGEEAWRAELERLRSEINVCLLKGENEEQYWTYSGLREYLRPSLGAVRNLVQYPESGLLGFDTKPKEMRPYQKRAVAALIEGRHCGIESATGTGKTREIEALLNHHGLPSVVVTPSRSIARQMFREFQSLFGIKKVGLFGDGKHDLGKHITVAIAASLTKVESGTPAALFFARTQV